MTDTYEMAVQGRRDFRNLYRGEREENKKLRLALEFYADEINHAMTQMRHPVSVCAQDRGRLARVALGRSDDDGL